MRRIAGLVLLLTFAATAAWSQTVIDLGPGGGVRSKTWKDYERDGRTPAQQLADSLAYRDCLTRAFNALATDSLAQAETLFRRALKLMPEQPANAIVHYELGLIAGAQRRPPRNGGRPAPAGLRLPRNEPAGAHPARL